MSRKPPDEAVIKRQREDKEMVTNPPRWPNWPFLPIKRYKPEGGFPDCAVLIDGNKLGEPIDRNHATLRTALLINMFDLGNADAVKKAERKEYASVDEMLADGWMVD